MSNLYAIVFAMVVCAMCLGHGITASRWGFAAFFAAMTAYNVVALIGAVT